jgi:hypothetical protein
MLNPLDAWRRWFGALFLILALGSLIWGQTVLHDFLATHPRTFIFYWLACFGFTGLSIVVAMVDFMVIRRRGRREQKSLFKDSFVQREGRNPEDPSAR